MKIITSLITREMFRKFSSFAAKEFVDKSATLAWCAGDKCENIIQINLPRNLTPTKSAAPELNLVCDVTCSGCGYIWCFNCKYIVYPLPSIFLQRLLLLRLLYRQLGHFPIPCDKLKWFVKNYGKIEREDNDQQSMKWIAVSNSLIIFFFVFS